MLLLQGRFYLRQDLSVAGDVTDAVPLEGCRMLPVTSVDDMDPGVVTAPVAAGKESSGRQNSEGELRRKSQLGSLQLVTPLLREG